MGFLTKERKLTDLEKLKAAYMLNLCTVSVSQIIDYNDINVMEQEYNAILNNLNLQEMPKDEAFLNILKELLNTITFFRIQEGDKKFIEHEYQQKMKNAIWNSVPNLSVIVATGNPIAMAVSLAAQAGISYMNYRKTKAQNLLEKESQEWQLQRAAIEQFNVIRRELFDTAWRIADKYNFPDNYRLTEIQIKQFNDILMDANLIRKYERLEAIEENFIAYPPFWYHYGNTANAISIEHEKDTDKSIYEIYRKRAISYFEHFDTVNLPLLREDQLAASCELEYAELLDPEKDKEKILNCINKAKKLAGRELDVLQLCAFAYQRVGAVEAAEDLFRMLVNENYNKNTNAQILSRIYVARAIANSTEEEKKLYQAQYELLKERQINQRYLFPMEFGCNEKELMDKFVQNQKEILSDKMELVIDSIFNKYGILFNKVIPKPNGNKDYDDLFYSTSEKANKIRKETYESELSNLKLLEDFGNQYKEIDITLDWIDIFNTLLDSLCLLKSELDIDLYTDKLSNIIFESSKELDTINGVFDKEKLTTINKYNFNFFTDQIKAEIKAQLNKKIDILCILRNEKEDKRMNNLSIFEGELRDICNKEKINEPEVLFDEGIELISDTDNRRLPVSLLGTKAEQRKSEKDKESVLIDKIRDASVEIANGQLDKVKFYFKNEESDEMGRYFAPEKLKNYKSQALAVMDFVKKGLGNNDLIFTKNGFLFVHNNSVQGKGRVIPYSDVHWNSKQELCIGNYEYKNKVINQDKLYTLCNLLAKS